ncbi:cation:proton antiporter [candidate division WOR-3 bacterium]|nr:cation:proton antiporter [candidate division WOR-3 bacterium]
MKIIFLAFLLVVFYISDAFQWINNPGMQLTVFIGFILISSFIFSNILAKTNLPKVTLYTIFGILIGPYILNISPESVVINLRFIDQFTLIVIAFMAGSELELKFIKSKIKEIVSITFLQIIFVFITIFALVMIFNSKLLPFISGYNRNMVFKVAIIMGFLGPLKSPLTTIAVIDETKAKGSFTELLLGIVIFKDISMLLLFPIMFILIGTSGSSSPVFILIEILMSIGAGVLIGFIIKFSNKILKDFQSVFLFILSFIIIEVSGIFHIDLLLTAIVAGFYIRNFTDISNEFSSNIKNLAFFVFIIFFTINGITLELSILRNSTFSVFIILVLIAVFNQLGLYFGVKLNNKGKLAISEISLMKYSWPAFINKSGLSIAIAILVEQYFPSFGVEFRTFIIAMVIVTDFIGPPLFKWAIIKTGEGKIES